MLLRRFSNEEHRISSCLRDSMGITDAAVWTFEIATEPSSTITTSTTSQSSATTLLNRTVSNSFFLIYSMGTFV